jgi:hypothetical protein
MDIIKLRQEYIHFFQIYKDIQIMNREERYIKYLLLKKQSTLNFLNQV